MLCPATVNRALPAFIFALDRLPPKLRISNPCLPTADQKCFARLSSFFARLIFPLARFIFARNRAAAASAKKKPKKKGGAPTKHDCQVSAPPYRYGAARIFVKGSPTYTSCSLFRSPGRYHLTVCVCVFSHDQRYFSGEGSAPRSIKPLASVHPLEPNR